LNNAAKTLRFCVILWRIFMNARKDAKAQSFVLD